MHVRLDILSSAMRCTAAGVLVTSLTLLPMRLSALELGDLTLESSPGQPLQARIALTDLGGVAPGDVTVTLGSEQDFAQAGLNYAAVLGTLNFAVQPDTTDAAVVRVSSGTSPSATTLAFVLQASSSQGTVSRTYTVNLASAAPTLARNNAQAPLGAQPVAAPATSGEQSAGRDELTLLSGDQGPTGSADLQATIAQLENELMLSEENLDRARLENRELTERLVMLEEQITILRNIITIEDERLAQMQTDLARQAEDAARAQLEQRENSNGLLNLLRDGSLKWLVGLGGVLVLMLGGMAFANNRRREALVEADEYELEGELDGDVEVPDLSEAGAVVEAPLPAETDTTGDEQLLMSSRYRYPDDPDDGATFVEGERVELEHPVAGADQAGPTLELDTLDVGALAFDDTTMPEEEEEPSFYPEHIEAASDTKLDLAVAYEAMGDLPGALEILDEVLAGGDEAQQAEAQRLKEKWQNA